MIFEKSHRRLNPLTGEWVLVSPKRAKRPWQGKVESSPPLQIPDYLADCYLCPGNRRANGNKNPNYTSTYVFDNDFTSLDIIENQTSDFESELIQAKAESGICKVVCFSPKHNLTLAELHPDDIKKIIKVWQDEYVNLRSNPHINHVQIFENKGDIMGCSNPHPHGQIWAQNSIPNQVMKEQINQKKYFEEKKRTLLSDYIKIEKQTGDRIVYENESFVTLVPFWALWPFETMIISKHAAHNISELSENEAELFAKAIKDITVRYDNVFQISFPYSAGIHQSPTDIEKHPEWHFHMHFYPPLLRSATIKKFMVGYELLAETQRDISPEECAKILKQQSTIHYSVQNNKEQN